MAKKGPVTKIRIRVPRGMKVEDILSKLELSFEEVDTGGVELNSSYCCVDVAVVGPVSTISAAPGRPDDTGYA
ncbi:hypothetical protein [Parasphingorhabdus sp.]|jgi:hypothetical protein|uniref:hypothetical protein n=1 Tax=Parasphingorhabdus sp. TaxID=2709688 RepID=UPI001B63C057|nr:hypothetical protein [Parasphingorhabdus sp.]MBQ0772027.1 hypothetical protein [Sphingomonadales bacterium]|tara:strand:+ start:1863 stop:2081 length:219 start_codon:yes stop_codon:yes gene_type:complete